MVEQLKCSLSLSLLQVGAVQMCDVVNEIELARARCENKTAGNVTSGDIHKTALLCAIFTVNKQFCIDGENRCNCRSQRANMWC